MASAAHIHQRMFDVIDARDFAGLRDLYHPDYVYIGGDGVEHKSADHGVAIAETYTQAFPDMRFEYRHRYQPDDRTSIIEFIVRGTHQGDLEGLAPTGRTVEMPVCNVIEVADDRIVQEREYFDEAALMTQLGVDMGG